MLADRLRHFAGRADVVVLALPRGGVPVAYEVARALGAPLDVCVVRKLGLCASTPEPFRAVGLWYADFSQTTDEQVRQLLSRAHAGATPGITRSA